MNSTVRSFLSIALVVVCGSIGSLLLGFLAGFLKFMLFARLDDAGLVAIAAVGVGAIAGASLGYKLAIRLGIISTPPKPQG